MEAIGEWGGLDLTATKQLAEVANGYTYFREGDVLVAKITPCFENGKSAFARGLLNGIGFGTTELHVLRPSSKLDARFLTYVTYGDALRKLGQVEMKGAAGQQRVPEEFLKNFRVPIPSVAEQRIIADFLDRETARIDALVAKKERLIELLQEKRTALITRAVTKGLDPTVPMKDSGVEWLGQIPDHWQLRRLKFIAELQTGLTLGKDYGGRQTVTRPYLRVANVQDGYLDLSTITEVDVTAEEAHRYELRRGDVLMTEGGDFDKLGRGYVWRGQIPGCLHQNHIFAVRPKQPRLKSQYLALLTTSAYGKAYFTSTSQQTTNLATTDRRKVRGFTVPVPPPAEQSTIDGWLDEENGKIDTLIAKIRDGIQRLREYRTALISAAVTGKIDVRAEG
jgi:type I restriction enzyme, S subunit